MTILMKAGGRLSLVRKWFKYLKVLAIRLIQKGPQVQEYGPWEVDFHPSDGFVSIYVTG